MATCRRGDQDAQSGPRIPGHVGQIEPRTGGRPSAAEKGDDSGDPRGCCLREQRAGSGDVRDRPPTQEAEPLE